MKRYLKLQPSLWKTWYQERITGARGTDEKKTAEKAGKHANTPATAYFDTLGRPYLMLVHNRYDREKSAGIVETVDEKYLYESLSRYRRQPA